MACGAARMTYRSQFRARWRSFLLGLGLLLLQAVVPGCEHDKVSRVRIELKDLPSEKPAVSTKPIQPPPVCPPAGVMALQPGAPGTGDHKVTLTWNASAPSGDSNSAAVGYCLYRSKVRGAAKKNPVCKDCEQVNRIPVPTSISRTRPGCIDDVVADSARYFYVVTAINSKSILSAPSNEIPVRIPDGHSVKPSQPGTLPLCRAAPQPQAQ